MIAFPTRPQDGELSPQTLYHLHKFLREVGEAEQRFEEKVRSIDSAEWDQLRTLMMGLWRAQGDLGRWVEDAMTRQEASA
ncbi:hypothetical protein ACFL5Q_05640 [Planctomycetota bacterium]